MCSEREELSKCAQGISCGKGSPEGMEADDLLGSLRADFAKGKLILGTKLPKAGEEHSHTEKPGMLEPKGQALLEKPNADNLVLIEHL